MVARAGGRSARGGVSGRRGPREEGNDRTGQEAESKGWSGGSNETPDAETEEDGITTGAQGGDNNTLTASPWGTQ